MIFHYFANTGCTVSGEICVMMIEVQLTWGMSGYGKMNSDRIRRGLECKDLTEARWNIAELLRGTDNGRLVAELPE